MALTSRDETDLLLPLFAGIREEPRFSTFLARLRRRTGAEYVGLVMRHAHASIAEAVELFAGRDLRRQARETGTPELLALDRLQYEHLRPGRVYSMSELIEHDPVYRAERARQVRRLGLADERVIRLTEIEGSTVWLMLARASPCSAADSALLSNLAPYLTEALRTMIVLERQQIEGAIGAAGLARSGTGWILFDREARVLGIDDATRQALQAMTGADARPGERLRGVDLRAERELIAAAGQFAADPGGAQRAVVLSEAPRLEALLLPSTVVPATMHESAAMLALCRLPRPHSPERIAQLSRLLDLPPREAELAIALGDGLSIAEAAHAMGLTIETARNYSKRLYAKLGVRGQAELVRAVYESSAALA
ncbi:helix-turn-helix transcriptional regulator [Novosphingobium album (ex Liu et al. 2023)]|uniref:LuxR family transcriptional regulator n=1 Tax=Novosphingobium album (ex Liu et al. 2023) TaxID=3031130 RepID=A0ABT5WUE3_9SPHN|nr:LuxR family transcriptional regulator [Novosphingobium album (ex Liu et al. 2023)]MDE8653486.1 LuxR family transcriptional regulator [Novosphingobium album (ex Liu et al. 2023)]